MGQAMKGKELVIRPAERRIHGPEDERLESQPALAPAEAAFLRNPGMARSADATQRQSLMLALQQRYGNAYVQRVVAEFAAQREVEGGEAVAQREEQTRSQEGEDIPSDTDADAERRAAAGAKHESAAAVLELPAATRAETLGGLSPQLVTTILRPGQPPQTFAEAAVAASALDSAKHTTVSPGGSPSVDNNASENTCTPRTSGAVLNWDVVSADADNWGVNVTSLTLTGQIKIKPWPSRPSEMVVPNTANPVDGGNINNTAGSSNHWQAAIDDMADYHSPGGGAGPNWHSTAASSAHEWAHWNQDYVADSVNSAAGGNWPQTNRDLDALREPKSSSADATAARTALQAKVDTRMATWRSATIARWNAIPDSPGVAGSRGYDAGMAVLNGLISAVRAYATSKGWTGGGTPGGSAGGGAGGGGGAPGGSPTGTEIQQPG